jgi:hypothetical protein
MPNKKINRGKILLVFILGVLFVFGMTNFEKKYLVAAESDAIAVRVMANPKHLSPLAWYLDQGFKGNPTPLTVDGYDAVQDGRTVYANVANIFNNNTLYTNIYLISYNQSAKPETVSIFTNILSKWKFNTNLIETGTCFNQSKKCQGTDINCNADSDCSNSKLCVDVICLSDQDCAGGGFCSSLKGKITRDTKRLAEVVGIKAQVENYSKRIGHYPLLKSGTYITGKTISTWPSWKGEFTTELGSAQAVDPINKMGACAGFDAITCWDDKTKTFAGTIPGGLPANSRALVYSTDTQGHSFTACALMESGLLIGDVNGACLGSETTNLPPVINCGTLVGIQNQEFTGYVSATDPENDHLTFTFSGLPSGFNVVDTGDPNKKMITSASGGEASGGGGGASLPTCNPLLNLSAYSPSCQNKFKTVINKVVSKRISANKVLSGLIGGASCSDCNCRSGGGTNPGSYTTLGSFVLPYSGLSGNCLTAVNADMSAMGITTADLGGSWFVFNENENENPSFPCTDTSLNPLPDTLFIYGCSYINLPFYLNTCGGPEPVGGSPTCKPQIL